MEKLVGEYLWEFFLQPIFQSRYVVPIFGTCWPQNVPMGDVQDSEKRFVDSDVDIAYFWHMLFTFRSSGRQLRLWNAIGRRGCAC